MFGLSRRPADVGAVQVAEPSVPPQPQSAPAPAIDPDLHLEYVDTAKRLGVVNGALKREMLLHACREHGINVYERRAVERYLETVFGRPRGRTFHGTWGWRPLRQVDERKVEFPDLDSWGQSGHILRGLYQGAVPLPVLLTVERLSAAVPDVYFFVSDKNEQSDYTLDPFLMVCAPGMAQLIVERWDEPNFRG